MPGQRGRRRGWTTLVVAGLLLALGASAAHRIHESCEAESGPASAREARFEPACPRTCSDPAHDHAGHDHATCPSCRLLAHAALGSSTTATVAVERSFHVLVPSAPRASSRVAAGCSSPRGPPPGC